MMNNRRRNFRGRQQKNNFRRRGPSSHNVNGHFSGNQGNRNFSRNGSLDNPASIEKVISKYQQLAKDAQSSGDPVLVENYLQHADHFTRILNEKDNLRREKFSEAKTDNSSDIVHENNENPEIDSDKN